VRRGTPPHLRTSVRSTCGGTLAPWPALPNLGHRTRACLLSDDALHTLLFARPPPRVDGLWATLLTGANTPSCTDPLRPSACLSELDAIADPPFDVRPSIADVLANREADRTLAPVAPCVQRLDWNVEVIGQFHGGQEAVVLIHGLSLRSDPFERMSLCCPHRRSSWRGWAVLLVFRDCPTPGRNGQLEGS